MSRMRIDGGDWKNPKSVEAFKQEIIEGMKLGRALIARLKRTGEYDKYYPDGCKMNPDGLPELCLGLTATPRKWQAASQLEAEGVVRVVGGALDCTVERPHAYLVAGPKFPTT